MRACVYARQFPRSDKTTAVLGPKRTTPVRALVFSFMEQRTVFKMPAHELVCVAMMAGGIFLAATVILSFLIQQG